MTKRLTIEQLMVLEILTGKEYTLASTPRKRPRRAYESKKLGITKLHHNTMRAKTSDIKSSKLKELLATHTGQEYWF